MIGKQQSGRDREYVIGFSGRFGKNIYRVYVPTTASSCPDL